jgi:hypothetical protein
MREAGVCFDCQASTGESKVCKLVSLRRRTFKALWDGRPANALILPRLAEDSTLLTCYARLFGVAVGDSVQNADESR